MADEEKKIKWQNVIMLIGAALVLGGFGLKNLSAEDQMTALALGGILIIWGAVASLKKAPK